MLNFLIADDNDGKAMMLEAIIQKWGKADQILRARTTQQAKDIVNSTQLTWAFIDYEMPQEDGPAVIRHIKQKQPQCLVAMVTSGNSDYYREGAAKSGADAFVCTSNSADQVEADLLNVLIEWDI